MIALKRINHITYQVVNTPLEIRLQQKKFSGETHDQWTIHMPNGRWEAETFRTLQAAKAVAEKIVLEALRAYCEYMEIEP